MKLRLARFFACQLAFVSAVLAGPTPDAKGPAAIAPSPPAGEHWEFTLTPYAWGAGLEGVAGIRGFQTDVDLPLDTILDNLDMIGFLGMEARHGRWGGWVDGAYLKISGGPAESRPLFDSIGLGLEQLMVEGAIFYRLLDGPRGTLDLYGGARYLAIHGDLSLGINDSALRDVSRQLSAVAVDQLTAAIRSKAQPALLNARNRAVDALATEARERVTAIVTERVNQVGERIEDIREVAAAHPGLAEILRNSERFKEALKAVAEYRIQQRLAELELAAADAKAVGAAAKAELQATASRARSRAEKAVDKVEKKLAKAIESSLRRAIPENISGEAGWVDPFVGLRAHFGLTDRFYLTVKGDIGGFGVSSDLTWQTYGALGWHLNAAKSAAIELGYRHLAVDYQHNGFTYDVSLSGVMLSLGFKF